MEKTQVADQVADARAEQVCRFILEHRAEFARSGAVVAGWRVQRGRRFGPYFRLIWRKSGRERSRYLGRSPESPGF